MQGFITVIDHLSFYGVLLLLLKALILLVISFAVVDVLEHRAAASRHSVWLVCLISLVMLPILSGWLPPLNIPLVKWTSGDAVAAGDNGSLMVGLLAVFVAVVLIRALRLLLGVLHIAWITARATPFQYCLLSNDKIEPRVSVKISPSIRGPMTWGCLRAFILLPQRALHWSAAERDMVIQHELAHIRRRDWWAQLLGQWVAILYWPVPGVNALLQKLSLAAECACDDQVLGRGVAACDYAGVLLRQARVTRLDASVALARPSELSIRIGHIVDRHAERSGASVSRLLVAVAIAALLVPLAALRLVFVEPYVQEFHHWPTVASEVSLPAVAEYQYDFPSIEKPLRPVTLSPPQSSVPVAVSGTGDQAAAVSLPTGVMRTAAPPVDSVTPHIDHGAPSHIVQPQLIERAVPAYPVNAVRRGIEGRVIVEFDIGADGSVSSPRVVSAQPIGVFERVSLAAVRAARYAPMMVEGVPTLLRGQQETFVFQLRNQSSHWLKPDSG